MAGTTTEYKTPHVHTAIANILNTLGVAKGGVLPSNMGGKPYITAVDVAREVKAQFVENNLIFLPRETIFKHEGIINKDRINVLISLTGEYTFVSTEDGSSVTVSGTGDGLAGGTAVASNIASTNALKNALLRTFLITEQSVEDAAKSGPDEAPNATTQKIERARNTPAPPPATQAAKAKPGSAQDTIRVKYIETGKMTPVEVNAIYDKLKAGGLNSQQAFEKILADLESAK